jgi:effector-binding domain-containing protein
MAIAASPELVTRPAQPSIVVPVEASLNEWNRAIEKIPEVIGWIQSNEIEPASPLFFRYLRIGDETRPFQLEIGFALNEHVEGSGNVVASELPGGTYLTYLHHGHPDKLFEISETLAQWASENGVECDVTSDGIFEHWAGRFDFFLTDPEMEPDRDNWEIKIAWLTRNQTTD